MDWHDIWILYRREVRSALRERAIVVNTILMPLFLYPVILWVMFTAFTFVAGLAESSTSRLAIVGLPAEHSALSDTLRADQSLEIWPDSLDADSIVTLIAAGELDALVEFKPPAAGGRGLEDNFQVLIRYDRAVERSRRARSRVEGILVDYRSRWIDREASARGIPGAEQRQFSIVQDNVSSSRQMGALVMGMMIPMFLVLMVALGCFIPAIDSTAGERERSTWETLMTVAASRLSVVTAKYLYVATFGILAGVLNVSAMFVSLGAVVAPLLASAGAGDALRFSLPLLALPVMIVAAIALALFFAAAMMILAAFARGFKDGQAMVTPVYWLAILPILLGQQTDRTLTPAIAAIPVANAAMMIRDAINGVFLWPLIAETLAVLFAMVVGCLLLARAVLSFEDLLLGSFDGSFWRFAKDRLVGKRDVRDRAGADKHE